MATTALFYILLLLLSLWTLSTTAQIIDNLPACWQTCISQSGNLHCSLTDIKCICRASNGNFLPDVITCARGNCDNAMDANLLLTPLQGACSLVGAPISPAAIRNAQNAASTTSAVASVTVTTTVVTSSSPSSDRISTTTATTTLFASSTSASTSPSTSDTTAGPATYAAIFATSTTITTTTTDAKGDVYVLMLPTATTVTSITVIYPAGTGAGFGSSRSGMGSMATSATGATSLSKTVNGGAAATGNGAGRSGTESLTAQETNGAPLDYERSEGSITWWDRWLWVTSAALVLGCFM